MDFDKLTVFTDGQELTPSEVSTLEDLIAYDEFDGTDIYSEIPKEIYYWGQDAQGQNDDKWVIYNYNDQKGRSWQRTPGEYDVFYAEKFEGVWRTLYVNDHEIYAKKGATQLLAAASAALAMATFF